MQHPPTTQLSDLHQQAATRAVYDNAPAIESSPRLLLQALLRLRSRGLVRDLPDVADGIDACTSSPSPTR